MKHRLTPACLLLLFGWSPALAALPPFPKPNPEKEFAELKIFDAAGSPIRQPKEDWEGARERVSNIPDWKTWLEAQRKEVDEWMSARRDKVEWVAGWWHDFVSPRDGSFLTWTPDEPGSNTLFSPSHSGVPLTPKLHGAWVFGFRGRHAAKIQDAALLYRITGEQRYAEWAAGQLDFYATNYERWPLQTSKGRARLMHQSLDEAVNLIRYVEAARVLAGFPSAARRQLWANQLFKPEAALLGETFQSIHNISCWQRSAQAQVALLLKDETLWREAVDGKFGIRRQIAEGVTSEYLWFEQSLLYNNYVVSALLPFFRAAAREGRMPELREEMAILQNLMLSPTMLRFPNGELPTPADSTGGRSRSPNIGGFAAAYAVFPTPLGLQAAAKQRNWSTLLDPPAVPRSIPPLPEITSRNLESSRMALLRKGNWQVFFHYGQVHGSHAQAEALTYEAFYGGTDITHDAGTVGYGSPLHRDYYTKGLAHNVPLISGEGQERWMPGELLRFDADAGSVAARQPNYRRGVSAERELRIVGERFVDVTTIVSTNSKHKAGLALHLQGVFELPSMFAKDPEFAKQKPAAFACWKAPRSAEYTDTANFILKFGNRRMRLTISTPGAFTVTHGSAPDVPPKRREALYLETGGPQATFTTVIEPASP